VIVLYDILVLSVTVSNPCNNGGICIGIGGTTYSCDCALRYTGSQPVYLGVQSEEYVAPPIPIHIQPLLHGLLTVTLRTSIS
jgi:hypothetical protein